MRNRKSLALVNADGNPSLQPALQWAQHCTTSESMQGDSGYIINVLS